jgi:hypothetical protein
MFAPRVFRLITTDFYNLIYKMRLVYYKILDETNEIVNIYSEVTSCCD